VKGKPLTYQTDAHLPIMGRLLNNSPQVNTHAQPASQ
jgi:hypothetical protein